MKLSISFAIGLLLFLSTTLAFSKTPTKEFMSKKVGIWVPSLAEPEARDYTLQEFVDNAFRNVTSKSWDETDDSWILITNIKDPMTKKKNVFKMQFLKTDKVAGPRRIVMDGEDYPMRNASPFMHTLLGNVTEKLGQPNKIESEKTEKKIEFIDRILGKYCFEKIKIEIKRVDSNNLEFKQTGGTCDINKNLLIKKTNSALVITEFKPGCGINIEDTQFSGARSKPILRWECPDFKDSVTYFGCSPNVPSMPTPCD